jgi:hypothetical protein
MMAQNIGERILDYLRVGRAHTAASEMFGMALAAYLGGVRFPLLLAFVLLGWLVHVGGFGMNSLMDFMYGYDAADPAKAHHPLPAGRMRVSTAMLFVFASQLAAMMGFMMMSRSYPADLAFAAYVAAGWWYNVYAKRHKLAAVLDLGVSYAALFLAAAMVRGALTPLIAMAALYTGVSTSFTIGVAGDVKDIDSGTDEVNILRDMGTRVEGGNFIPSRAAVAWALSLNLLRASFLVAAAYIISRIWALPVAAMAYGSFIYYSLTLMRAGPFRHEWRLKVMGAGEAWAYVALVITVMPLMISWLPAAAALFLAAPVAYFYAMNRIMWPHTGSGWAPGV